MGIYSGYSVHISIGNDAHISCTTLSYWLLSNIFFLFQYNFRFRIDCTLKFYTECSEKLRSKCNNLLNWCIIVDFLWKKICNLSGFSGSFMSKVEFKTYIPVVSTILNSFLMADWILYKITNTFFSGLWMKNVLEIFEIADC